MSKNGKTAFISFEGNYTIMDKKAIEGQKIASQRYTQHKNRLYSNVFDRRTILIYYNV